MENRSLLLAVILFSTLFAQGCSFKSTTYYERHPTSVVEMERKYGKPFKIDKLGGGAEKRYYRLPNTMGGGRWFMIKGDRVIDTGI